MKIVLIMPHDEMHGESGGLKRALRYASLTLTTLAALVPSELKAQIEILDEGVERLDLGQIDADLVGITATTVAAERAYEISDQLRARGMTTVLGGIHPTLLPEEAQPHADSVVVGCAEQTWPQLLLDFVAGRMRPRYVQPAELSLQSLPEPRRDLLKKAKYLTVNTVQTSRGCPHHCSFCVAPAAWSGHSRRPVGEVVTEIERLHGNKVLFLDMNLMEDGDYCKNLFRRLSSLRRIWAGLATIRVAEDEELLQLAHQSGCRGLLIGMESLSRDSLIRAGKSSQDPARYEEAIDKIHDYGIGILACFVLGLDGDDVDIFERTVEFVNRTAIELPRFSVPTPFPGTGLYRHLKGSGRLISEDWSLFDEQHVVFHPLHMSAERLREGFLWTWKEAYRLSSITRRLFSSSASELLMTLQFTLPAAIGFRFFSRRLPRYLRPVIEPAG